MTIASQSAWNWQAIEAFGVWATFCGAVVNVLLFRRYLRLTRGIQRAALDQAEGQSRPVIVVACKTTLPDDTREWLNDTIPTEIEGITPRLLNVGTGPAFDLRWKYERKTGPISGQTSYLAVGERFVFPFTPVVENDEMALTCEYKSRGDVIYISTTMLRGSYVISSRNQEKSQVLIDTTP
jgi:hypothetical protein